MRDPKVSLPEAPKLTLEQVGQERHYGARKRVVEQGGPPDAFYVVESGRLRVFLESPEGIQTELNKLGPGDYFGEMGMVTRLPRTATVETLEETVLREIPQPEFDRLLDQNPELARHIIRQLSYWLVKGDLRLSRVTQEEVKKRQISWVDYLLILGLGLILGFGFNYFNDQKIDPVHGWVTWGSAGSQPVKVETVSPEEARQAFGTGKTLFVDAQKDGFYEKLHIKDALSLPALEVNLFYDMRWGYVKEDKKLDKNTPIMVYGGNISRPFDQEVARFLIKKGHSNVRVLGGGYQAWKEGFDYSSGKPKPEPKIEEKGLEHLWKMVKESSWATLVEKSTLAIFLALLIPPVWRSPYLSLGCRMLLGIIFLAFSLSKIIHPAVFAQNTINYQMMPAWGVNLFALGLPGAELVAGLCLILGLRARAAATVIGGMNLMFIVGLTYALLQGVPINCGCYGETGEPVTWDKIATNVGMLVMSLQIFLYDRLFVLDRGGLIWRVREV